MRRLHWAATMCPHDKTPLSWEVYGGMRVFRVVGTHRVYRCTCEKCDRRFEVRRRLTDCN